MKTERFVKPAFSVIGREGSTRDGAGVVQELWAAAHAHFEQIAELVKRDEAGVPVGFWGAMSDFSRSFLPWEEGFSQGLYLAGAECRDDAQAPEGWTRWEIPGFEYYRVECDHEGVFPEMIAWLEEQRIPLAGAVQDFTCPKTGKSYMLFPLRKL